MAELCSPYYSRPYFLSDAGIKNSCDKNNNSSESKGATSSLLTDEFFQSILGTRGTLLSWYPFEIPQQSIGLTTSCKAIQDDDRMIGHQGFEITYRPSSRDSARKTLRVVAKCKPLALKFVNIFGDWIEKKSGEVSQYAEMFRHVSYFRNSDVREIKVMTTQDPRFTDISPKVHHTVCDPSKEIFVIVMEDLTDRVTHLNTINNASEVWDQEDIKVVLRDIARFHTIHLGNVTNLESEPWMCSYSGSLMKSLSGFWRSLLCHNRATFPDLWTTKRTNLVRSFIDNMDHVWKIIDSFPRTLVHYDFTPRNVCLRKQEFTKEDHHSRVFIVNNKLCRVSCIYDWEMATIHAPQHDVVEFLAFVLPGRGEVSTRSNLVRFYQEQLEKSSGMTFNSEQFMNVFIAVCCVYALHQLSLKTITHSVTRLPYFERAVQSHMGFLEDLEARGWLKFLYEEPI